MTKTAHIQGARVTMTRRAPKAYQMHSPSRKRCHQIVTWGSR